MRFSAPLSRWETVVAKDKCEALLQYIVLSRFDCELVSDYSPQSANGWACCNNRYNTKVAELQNHLGGREARQMRKQHQCSKKHVQVSVNAINAHAVYETI